DWFSDSDWEKVLSKTQFIAKAAKAAGCVGIVLDPESYGRSPWKYDVQLHSDQYTYDQYSDKAFERGKQFIDALQGELPDLRLLMFYQYSIILHNTDPAAQKAALQKSTY